MTENEEVVHHYEYIPPGGIVPKPYATVEVVCPHCTTTFYLAADQIGGISDGDHVCSTGTWVMQAAEGS